MHGLLSQRARVHLRLALLLVALPVSSASAGENELPDWIPSAGIGAAIQSREVDGSIDAILWDSNSPTFPTRIAPCGVFAGLPQGFCNLSSRDTRAEDGAALDLSAQLLGPPLRSVFLKPRPFIYGRYELPFDSRTITEAGSNPNDFDTNLQETDIRTRLRGNPEGIWYVGGGVALQLPVEIMPVFLKIGVHYMEDRVDAIGTIDRKVGDEPKQTAEAKKKMTMPGVGPSLGVEAEIARFGPLALNFVADVLFSFPLSGTEAEFSVDEPTSPSDTVPQCSATGGTFPSCAEPAHFKYDADNVHYLGAVALRFSWIGF
jgi:hypothetical protein